MISVLLPTYNSATTLGVSIKSILNQSFRNFELLVLDDGSKDRTEELIRQYNDDRIKYSKLSHQGLTKTLNYGLSIAKYDIVARMDADDLCVPWRFERQLKELQKYPKNILLSSWYAIFDNNKIQFVVETPTESEKIKKGLLLHSYISHPGLMCYNKTLIENGGYISEVEIDAFQDYETWLKIKDIVEFAVIPEVLTFQRYRTNSLSNNIIYKQRIMYSIQEPYYKDIKRYFGISDSTEENLYRGWREYFYGDKGVARKYWNLLESRILSHPRVIIALIVTFLPEKQFIKFKESRIKYRLHYIINYLSIYSRRLRKSFRLLNINETT